MLLLYAKLDTIDINIDEDTRYIEIAELDPGQFFVFYYDNEGRMLCDGCYFSVEEAKKQVYFDFHTENLEWYDSPSIFPVTIVNKLYAWQHYGISDNVHEF